MASPSRSGRPPATASTGPATWRRCAASRPTATGGCRSPPRSSAPARRARTPTGRRSTRPSCPRASTPSPQVLRKATLVALSRAIEHETLAHAAAPVLFAAFQREPFYREVEPRYARIAQLRRRRDGLRRLPAGPPPGRSARPRCRSRRRRARQRVGRHRRRARLRRQPPGLGAARGHQPGDPRRPRPPLRGDLDARPGRHPPRRGGGGAARRARGPRLRRASCAGCSRTGRWRSRSRRRRYRAHEPRRRLPRAALAAQSSSTSTSAPAASSPSPRGTMARRVGAEHRGQPMRALGRRSASPRPPPGAPGRPRRAPGCAARRTVSRARPGRGAGSPPCSAASAGRTKSRKVTIDGDRVAGQAEDEPVAGVPNQAACPGASPRARRPRSTPRSASAALTWSCGPTETPPLSRTTRALPSACAIAARVASARSRDAPGEDDAAALAGDQAGQRDAVGVVQLPLLELGAGRGAARRPS